MPTFRYLSMNLDQTLNFKYHLDSMLSNISFKLYLFNKIRRFVNEKSAIIIYKSMLIPFFDYCDIVFMFSGGKELSKLDRHHHRGLRICTNSYGKIDELELYNKCKISDLDTRKRVHLRNYMFKNKDFCIEDDNINTRLHDGPVFNVTHPNSESIKRGVMYAGALEWNDLDADVRNIEEFSTFKKIQKSWMINSFMY